MSGSPPVLSIDDEGVATITLARPAHLNRLHREDLLALQHHFDRLRGEPGVRVLVLTGEGRVFCAGFHLGQLGETAGEDGGTADDPQLFERTVDMLEALPLPTVARLNGSVYGGATDLALACDFRIGVDGMELRMPAARLGLHYYPSGLRRYVTRLGLGAAKRLFLLADTVPAEELLAIGYLDRCVSATTLDDAVRHVADALAAGAPLAVRGMKASLDEIAGGRDDLATLRAREARCAASDDLREGLRAFAERRAPRFGGH
jgi:enoyl-CoA hydratase/carnithine racemase